MKAASRCSGKQKEKENNAGVSSIAKSPRTYDMVINPPVFLKKDGEIQKRAGGSPLAEIFEVRVISGGKKYSKIHGDIRIGSNSGLLYLFDRSRLNPQIVHRKDPLELVGPSLAINASGNVDIALHLTDDRNRVIRVVVNWTVYRDAYDMVYSDVFYGRKGSIQISYVVYFHSVVATIAVTFKPNRSVGGIYGTITASNKMFPHWRSILFNKKRGDHLLSVSGQEEELELPLLRSVVAVPSSSTSVCKMDPADRKFDTSVYKYGDTRLPKRALDGCLMINVNLMNGCDDDDGTIANGVLKFPTENYGDYISTMLSEYGEIQAKVSFLDIHDHLPRKYLTPGWEWVEE